jgi:hypothetical protein
MPPEQLAVRVEVALADGGDELGITGCVGVE